MLLIPTANTSEPIILRLKKVVLAYASQVTELLKNYVDEYAKTRNTYIFDMREHT